MKGWKQKIIWRFVVAMSASGFLAGGTFPLFFLNAPSAEAAASPAFQSKSSFDHKALTRILKELQRALQPPVRGDPLGKALAKIQKITRPTVDPKTRKQILTRVRNAAKPYLDRRALAQMLSLLERMMRQSDQLAAAYVLERKYFFPEKRDPFVPLKDKEAPRKIKIAYKNKKNLSINALKKLVKKTQKFRKFGGEIKKLNPIPFELYRKIKTSDPSLYAGLERYAELFGQKNKLRQMTMNAYLSEVHRYKQLIDRANATNKKTIKTPLQIAIKSLRLVGIIWGGAEPIALIETLDKKGHTARAGTFVGTHFGVVQSINPGRIAIVERNRDFLGNIMSDIQEIRLIQAKETKKAS